MIDPNYFPNYARNFTKQLEKGFDDVNFHYINHQCQYTVKPYGLIATMYKKPVYYDDAGFEIHLAFKNKFQMLDELKAIDYYMRVIKAIQDLDPNELKIYVEIVPEEFRYGFNPRNITRAIEDAKLNIRYLLKRRGYGDVPLSQVDSMLTEGEIGRGPTASEIEDFNRERFTSFFAKGLSKFFPDLKINPSAFKRDGTAFSNEEFNHIVNIAFSKNHLGQNFIFVMFDNKLANLACYKALGGDPRDASDPAQILIYYKNIFLVVKHFQSLRRELNNMAGKLKIYTFHSSSSEFTENYELLLDNIRFTVGIIMQEMGYGKVPTQIINNFLIESKRAKKKKDTQKKRDALFGAIDGHVKKFFPKLEAGGFYEPSGGSGEVAINYYTDSGYDRAAMLTFILANEINGQTIISILFKVDSSPVGTPYIINISDSFEKIQFYTNIIKLLQSFKQSQLFSGYKLQLTGVARYSMSDNFEDAIDQTVEYMQRFYNALGYGQVPLSTIKNMVLKESDFSPTGPVPISLENIKDPKTKKIVEIIKRVIPDVEYYNKSIYVERLATDLFYVWANATDLIINNDRLQYVDINTDLVILEILFNIFKIIKIFAKEIPDLRISFGGTLISSSSPGAAANKNETQIAIIQIIRLQLISMGYGEVPDSTIKGMIE